MQAVSDTNQKNDSQGKKSSVTFSWLLRLGLSLLVLAALFYVLPTDQLGTAFSRVQPGVWGLVLILFLAGHAIAAFKWWLLVDGGASVSYMRSVRAHFAGLASNLCLPGVVGGDVVRAGLLFGETQSNSRVIIGSLTDRLLDSIVLLVLSFGGLIYIGNTQLFDAASQSRSILITITIIFVVCMIGFFVAYQLLPLLIKRFHGTPIGGLLEKTLTAFAETLAHPGRVLTAFSLSLAVQASFVGLTIILGMMIGLNASPSIWFFAWPLAKLVAVLPISLGGIGVREVGMATLMAPFNAPASLIVAASLLWQTILLSGGAIGGLIFIMSLRAKDQAKPYQHNVTSALDEQVQTSDTKAQPLESREAESDMHKSNENTSTREKLKIAILGAGPAGAAAALSLSRTDYADVLLLERNKDVGGNASSFELEGVNCDFGSHRLHPVADPRVLNEIKSILGDDLMLRPRHGRIHLQGRWIHFPLKPLDLLLRLPKAFTFKLGIDTLKKMLPLPEDKNPTFASVLHKGLGKTMSEAFYYPYVRKLCGLDPEELAVTLAHKRVSGNSVLKILKKISRQIPGLKTETSSGFYYPKKGFGQITRGLAEHAVEAGTDLKLNAAVEKIFREGNQVTGLLFTQEGQTTRVETDAVWSTLPISLAVRMMDPPPPANVLEAASHIKYRGMILIYLILETDQFSEYDAHYFPELSVPISRMSEPKNYSASTEPKNRTILCAELPCDPATEWQVSDEALGQHMCQWLESIGLPVTVPVVRTETRRLNFAYPVYDREFETHFDVMDTWLSSLEGFLTYGRQGLFAHDNTHHAMLMAYAACECLDADGTFNKDLWAEHRIAFEEHVVED